MENSEVSFIAISNGSSEVYPDNTLTKFKNKLPKGFEWRKNGAYRYHIAVESVGISTNFTTTKIPVKKENPSVILGLPLKWPQGLQYEEKLQDKETPIQNECLGVEKMPEACNTTILDPELNLLLNKIPNSFAFNYFFIEDELMTLKKYIKFFQHVVDNSNGNLTFRYDENTETIELKSIGEFTTGSSSGGSMFSVSHLFFHTSMFSNIDLELKSTDHPINDPDFYSYSSNLKMFNYHYTINGEEYYRIYLHYGFQSVKINLSNCARKNYPNIIKVKCGQIKSQIFNSHTSKDLIVFHPEIPETDTFFFHEVETKQFFPLENTILDTLDFLIVDEENNQLNLIGGIATILKLTIKKMSYYKKSFNVRITSKPSDLHPDNKSSHFTATLPQTLYFDSSWKVSVTNINLPNVFSTVPPDNFLQFTYRTPEDIVKKYVYRLKIENFTKEGLINKLNTIFEDQTNGEKLVSFHEDSLQDAYEKTLVIRIHKPNSGLQISKELAILLGYGSDDFTTLHDVTFKLFRVIRMPAGELHKDIRMSFPIHMNYYQPSYTILYSDIVSPTIVGGSYANILKVFPIHTNLDKYIIHQFKNPEYYPLLNNEVKSITLIFKNHAGETLNFASNSIVIVDLMFSNYF